jgi:hypothetical protein
MHFYVLVAALSFVLFGESALAVTCLDRISQAPVDFDDPMYGRWVAQQVEAEVIRQENLDCNVFSNFELDLEFYDFIGMTFFFTRSPASLGQRQLAMLKARVPARYFLFVTGDQASGNFFGKLYRLDGEIKPKTLNLVFMRTYKFALNAKAGESTKTSAFYRNLALIAPNSVNIGFSDTEVTLDLKEGYGQIETSNVGAVPPILSSISISRIDHSATYNTWDIAGSLFPGLFFFGINQYTTIYKMAEDKEPEDSEKTRLHMQAYGSCGNLNAMGTVHSPIGATYGMIGYGPCFMLTRKEDEPSRVRLNLAGRLQVGHRVFLIRRLFTYFEVDTLYFSESLYHSEYGKSARISRGMLGFGWYIPDAGSAFVKTSQYVGL